ncbi:PP2C family protein-serine/threonine phosphatase [Kitasatospora sp. CB01950]|uniref:PP2C family protein-serine/threonine phosphatase n=1 Tax=Kitasatospora sp. CB01950 TaxID=1703930 RepID=UPI0009F9F18D|nr:PP2C family protein-serine/threonine phosphatase [Kitasatospora sp. CB01950]
MAVRRRDRAAAAGSGDEPSARRRSALRAADLQDVSPLLRAAPALLAIGLVVAADLLAGTTTYLAPLMVVVPSVAALTLRPRELIAVCLLGLMAMFVLNRYYDQVTAPSDSRFLFGATISYIVLSAFSAFVAELRMRRAEAFAAVSSVAEAAQRALLRQPDPVVGPLRLSVRYVSAADAARIGGDLYSVLDTPYGTRVLVGDVRGKGLGAVQTAAVVLGAFREAAYDEERLSAVAARIEASMHRHVPDGEFATALFAEFRASGPVDLLHLGHVPPIRVRADGHADVLESADPWLPLGLGDLATGAPCATAVPFGPREVLVLCTDGVIEAKERRSGAFYPLAERVGPLVKDGWRSLTDLDTAVARLYGDLLEHTGGGLNDDALLLLVTRPEGG